MIVIVAVCACKIILYIVIGLICVWYNSNDNKVDMMNKGKT